MGRVFGLVHFAAALGVSVELYRHGVQGAFGGALSQGRERGPVTRTKLAADA